MLTEATGGYERLSVRLLAKAGLKVQRINPVRARQFAPSHGRAKTDPIDARMLAMFASALEDKHFVVPDVAREDLTELVNQRDSLVQQRDDNRRRMKQATLPVVLEHYKTLESTLRVLIKACDKQIAEQSRRVDADLLDA